MIGLAIWAGGAAGVAYAAVACYVNGMPGTAVAALGGLGLIVIGDLVETIRNRRKVKK